MTDDRCKKVLFLHHKCASSWMSRMFLEYRKKTGLRLQYNRYADSAQIIILQNSVYFHHKKRLKKYKGVHLIRDPRDVVISGYFSHLKTHPKNGSIYKFREKLQKVNLNKGLFLEMDREEDNFGHMYNWNYDEENIYEVKLEKIKGNKDEILKIFQFLDLLGRNMYRTRGYINKIGNRLNDKLTIFPSITLPKEQIIKIIENNSFKKLAGGRKPGQIDENSHYRKGISGDWKNYFTEAHKKFFKDRYGDLLIKLGYENNNDW